MKIYLVGGAIRDELLGLEVKERDWVVVGSTPEQMLALGFQPIGKEFPVFLHPETHEEYALARTERKVAKGYKGFTFYTDPDVTLESDLLRRDLTINAIAKDENGKLTDPYHGQDDLKAKLLRHVSPAFCEDPVRILRLARFAAKLPEFSIHPETITLMQKMVENGEVDALVAERVWQELHRALQCYAPTRFFDTLQVCRALKILFPQIKYDNKIKELLSPENTEKLKPSIRFAMLFSRCDIEAIKNFIKRYRIPKEFSELALLLAKHGQQYAGLDLSRASDILNLLQSADALRRVQRFNDFLTAAEQCYQPLGQRNQFLTECLNIINNVDTTNLQQQSIDGKAFAEKLNQLRVKALEEFIG